MDRGSLIADSLFQIGNFALNKHI